MTNSIPVEFKLNGKSLAMQVAPRTTLADFLRDERQLTGTHLGCEMGACGACLVRIDDKIAHSCLVLAVQVDGSEVVTIEGLHEIGEISDLQKAFLRRNAFQCGFCTTGMLMSAAAYLAEDGRQDRAAIRDALSGNYCRCTGYEAIIDAIVEVARQRQIVRSEMNGS